MYNTFSRIFTNIVIFWDIFFNIFCQNRQNEGILILYQYILTNLIIFGNFSGSPKDEESKDKDNKDDKTNKESSKEKPKKLAPLMNKNPFGGMMGAMGLDDDLLDDLDDMESKLFGRSSRKNQKKEEDPRLAYLKNIPQKHVEKIENEIMETLANVSWDEICGLQFVKGTIREIVILPFLRPDIFNGILQPPTGLLLFGPPGNLFDFFNFAKKKFTIFNPMLTLFEKSNFCPKIQF